MLTKHQSLTARQYPDEIATGNEQSRLGAIVTQLIKHPGSKIPVEELSKLKAADANYLEAYQRDPKPAKLIARYPWAPIAVYNSQRADIIQKEANMSISAANTLFKTIFNGIGVSTDSLIYTDGSLNYEEMRGALKAAKLRIATCGVRNDVYAAIKDVVAMFKAKDESLLQEGIVFKKVLDKGFNGGHLHKLEISQVIQGTIETKSVYFVCGVVQKAPAEKTPAPRAPAPKPKDSAPLGKQISEDTRQKMRAVTVPSIPTYEDVPTKAGRGRKNNGAKGKGKETNRKESRYQ